MKVINILFNFKKSQNDKKILGVERCFIDQAEQLISHGNQVISVTKNGMVFADDLKKVGSKLVEVPALGNGDFFSIIRLAWLFFFAKPDVIICHSGRALFFARMARYLSFRRFPIVGFDHGINPKKFLRADYVFTVNSYFSKELIKAGKAPDCAFVIPNMIDIPKNFTQITKRPFGRPLKLGSLGRLYPEKCFDNVIRAIAILKDRGVECEYVIGGVGPMEKELNDLARELKVEKNFKILGWTEDKKKFFDAIDIFLLPSFGETFGIVLLEAMLYSTPIITSNSWGPDEIITDSVDGLKVSKDDLEKMPELIADAVMKLAQDENFARKLAEKSYENFFQNYTAEIVGKRLDEMLKNIVNKSKNTVI